MSKENINTIPGEAELCALCVEAGASNAAAIPVAEIPFDPELRKACEQNLCGAYGKNWTCPPACGDIHELIDRAKGYDRILVFQTIGTLEDSFDYEGMMAASEKHAEVTKKVGELVCGRLKGDLLRLSAGGCRLCDTCAKADDEPCRHPDEAISSLEAYGMFVSGLAGQCGMNYINGQNTVTYFGGVLYHEDALESV